MDISDFSAATYTVEIFAVDSSEKRIEDNIIVKSVTVFTGVKYECYTHTHASMHIHIYLSLPVPGSPSTQSPPSSQGNLDLQTLLF